MKKQTAAQIRAAQAVVDREEAIEAERERRRAERARKAKEARSVWLSKRNSQILGAASEFGKLFRYFLGQIVQVVIGVSAVMVIAYFLTTAGSNPDLGSRLQASMEWTVSFWSVVFGYLPSLPGGVWSVVLAFLPWYIGFIALLIALKFAVFPLVRFVIRKVRN